MITKVPYVCGPLTELSSSEQETVKLFYQQIADVCEKTIGVRAFVPHEHYDPIKHAEYTPQDVYNAEKHQVCDLTSLLIVVAFAPSWGGGIEVEIANQNKVPVIILCEKEKLENRKVSRCLRGNPAVIDILTYTTEQEALEKLEKKLKSFA
jgi:2'-deoxynucleoside 5'-phosphate N-hydrolase